MNTLEFGGSSDKLKRIEGLEKLVNKQADKIEELTRHCQSLDGSLRRMQDSILEKNREFEYVKTMLMDAFKNLKVKVNDDLAMQKATIEDNYKELTRECSSLRTVYYTLASTVHGNNAEVLKNIRQINERIDVLQKPKQSETGTPLYTSPPALTVTDCPNSPNPL